jgi:hypothetical protein
MPREISLRGSNELNVKAACAGGVSIQVTIWFGHRGTGMKNKRFCASFESMVAV